MKQQFNDTQVRQIGEIIKDVVAELKRTPINIRRVTVNEAAEALGIDRGTVYDYAKKGWLDMKENKAGKKMISIKSIEELINAG